jgi:hypothetical protein
MDNDTLSKTLFTAALSDIFPDEWVGNIREIAEQEYKKARQRAIDRLNGRE